MTWRDTNSIENTVIYEFWIAGSIVDCNLIYKCPMVHSISCNLIYWTTSGCIVSGILNFSRFQGWACGKYSMLYRFDAYAGWSLVNFIRQFYLSHHIRTVEWWKGISRRHETSQKRDFRSLPHITVIELMHSSY